MKVLTVSIAAYNAEKYITKALDSLSSSIYFDKLEVIVVNDGSKDKTAEIVRKYVGKYPDSVVLVDKQNGGYGSTINSALKIASGKYFKLLDADDWYNTKELDKLIYYLFTATSDIVISNYSEYYENSSICINTEPLDCIAEQIFPIEDLTNYNLNPAMTIRTDVIKRSSFKITEKCFYTDLEFCTKTVLCAKNFVYFPASVYVYRIGREGQSISIEGKTKHIADHDYIVKMTARMILACPERKSLYASTYNILKGHISNYFFYVKPSLDNLKLFEDYRSFILSNAPETQKYFSYKEKKVFSKPRLYFLPVCFWNRLVYTLKQLVKRWIVK